MKLAYIKLKTSAGSAQEIIDAFSLVRTNYPASAEAAEALARIGFLHSKSSTAQAISDFTSFLSSNADPPLAASVQQSLGRLCLKTKEFDKAEAAFDAVKAKPGVSTVTAEESALQSGFVKIMRFYALKDKKHLQTAIDALSKLTSSTRLNIRARADLGIAEATLLMGKHIEAREKYTGAASAYANQPYFKAMALFGAACGSQTAGKFAQAAEDYGKLLDALPGSGLADKDAAWKRIALASTSRSVQVSVETSGAWKQLPGSEIIVKAVYSRGECLHLLGRHNEAEEQLRDMLIAFPSGEAAEKAQVLLGRCIAAKGGK